MPAGCTRPLTCVDPNTPVGVSLRSEKPVSVTCSPHDEVHSPPTTFCVSDSLENSIRKMKLEDETPMLPTPLSSILVATPARHDGATRFLPITDRGYQTLHYSVPCSNTTSTRTTGDGSPLYTSRCNVSFPTAELSFCTDGRMACGESGSFFCGAGLSMSEQLAGRTASLTSGMDTDAQLVLQDDMTDGSVSLPLAVPLMSSETIQLSDPVDAAFVSPNLQTHVVDHAVTAEQGTRRTMEDCHTTFVSCSDSVAFFGVYDGHGGSQCAEYLRDELHRLFLSHKKMRTDPEMAVREALLEADHSFLAAGAEGGAVCAVAVIMDDILVVANVGDVEVILSQRDSVGTVAKDGQDSGSSHQVAGPPRVLTVVHQPQRNGREGERVLEAGGKLTRVQRVGHPNNLFLSSLAVSRAIGDAGFKLPEYTDGKPSGVIADPHTCSLRLQSDRDEFLVMACDGLWDVIPYEEVQQLCRSAVAASGYAARAGDLTQMLVEEALMRGTTDNITVVVVGLGAFRTPPPPLPPRQAL